MGGPTLESPVGNCKMSAPIPEWRRGLGSGEIAARGPGKGWVNKTGSVMKSLAEDLIRQLMS